MSTAIASIPLVLEQAGRYRVVGLEDMFRCLNSWAKVLALVAINREVMPQHSDIEFLKAAETMHREIIITNSGLHKFFLRELGALVSSPAEQEVRAEELRAILATSLQFMSRTRKSVRSYVPLAERKKCWGDARSADY